MSHIAELAYMRMKEIVVILERELEAAEMAAYYAESPLEGGSTPDGSSVHYAYMALRARKAVDQAKAALAEIQVLAYEHGAITSLPEVS